MLGIKNAFIISKTLGKLSKAINELKLNIIKKLIK